MEDASARVSEGASESTSASRDVKLSREAQRLLDDYRRRLERALEHCRLRADEREDIRREIESHLHERLLRLAQRSSPQALSANEVFDVLVKLGDPDEYVPLYVMQSDLERGLRGSPGRLLRGLGRWLKGTLAQYLRSLPFVLCYLVSLVLLGLGGTKLLFPESVYVYYTTRQDPLATAVLDGKPPPDGDRGAPRGYFSIAVSFGIPRAESPRSDDEAALQRVDVLTRPRAAGLVGLGVLVGWGATWLLRRLTRWMLLKQHDLPV